MTTGAVVTVIQVFEKGMYLTDPLLYASGKLIGISYGSARGNSRVFVLTESTVGTNGDCYGVTDLGGSKDDGTVCKVDPKTNAVTFFYNFKGPSPAVNPVTTLLLATDGNFYGTEATLFSN
jgi:hypothetical protein